MSVGDVVSNIQNIAGGANLDYQPAAGVEAMITEIASQNVTGANPSQSRDVDVRIIGAVGLTDIANATGNPDKQMRFKIFVTNSIYLRLRNASVGAQLIGFVGVQIK